MLNTENGRLEYNSTTSSLAKYLPICFIGYKRLVLPFVCGNSNCYASSRLANLEPNRLRVELHGGSCEVVSLGGRIVLLNWE